MPAGRYHEAAFRTTHRYTRNRITKQTTSPQKAGPYHQPCWRVRRRRRRRRRRFICDHKHARSEEASQVAGLAHGRTMAPNTLAQACVYLVTCHGRARAQPHSRLLLRIASDMAWWCIFDGKASPPPPAAPFPTPLCRTILLPVIRPSLESCSEQPLRHCGYRYRYRNKHPKPKPLQYDIQEQTVHKHPKP